MRAPGALWIVAACQGQARPIGTSIGGGLEEVPRACVERCPGRSVTARSMRALQSGDHSGRAATPRPRQVALHTAYRKWHGQSAPRAQQCQHSTQRIRATRDTHRAWHRQAGHAGASLPQLLCRHRVPPPCAATVDREQVSLRRCSPDTYDSPRTGGGQPMCLRALPGPGRQSGRTVARRDHGGSPVPPPAARAQARAPPSACAAGHTDRAPALHCRGTALPG